MNQVRRPSAAAQSLLLWTLSFLHPHRGRVVLMIVLLLVQIGLGALQPWPLKIVIDYVLDGNPLPATVEMIRVRASILRMRW